MWIGRIYSNGIAVDQAAVDKSLTETAKTPDADKPGFFADMQKTLITGGIVYAAVTLLKK